MGRHAGLDRQAEGFALGPIGEDAPPKLEELVGTGDTHPIQQMSRLQAPMSDWDLFVFFEFGASSTVGVVAV